MEARNWAEVESMSKLLVEKAKRYGDRERGSTSANANVRSTCV
jgi:hypothetical protein